MTETWECPKCQTLNAFGDHCYGCGTARPDAPPEVPLATPADASPDPLSESPTFADALPPDLATWGMTPAAEPTPDEDTEPHPCWCNLVKGPHDTRDHPASPNSDDESAADRDADAQLDQLEADLGILTHDWTDPTVERSYDAGDDGEQEYEDQAMLFEEHGYRKWVDRPHGMIKATYTLGDGVPDRQ